MDNWQVILTLAGVIGTLSGFIALQFKQQLAVKDERIADKDKQILEGKAREERWQLVAETNGKGLTEAVGLLKEVLETVDNIEREVGQKPPRQRVQGQGR